MISVEQLIKTYETKTQNEFEYCLNLFVRDYNKANEKPTTFFKALEAVMRKCGDKYNYKKLLEEREQIKII